MKHQNKVVVISLWVKNHITSSWDQGANCIVSIVILSPQLVSRFVVTRKLIIRRRVGEGWTASKLEIIKDVCTYLYNIGLHMYTV